MGPYGKPLVPLLRMGASRRRARLRLVPACHDRGMQECSSKDERRRRWWQTADDWPADPEESRIRELQLRGYAPDGTPLLDDAGLPVKGLSREDVGLLKFKYREIDARAFGGSDDDRKIAKYAQEMSELGPPPPEPLEAAALAARQETAPEPASSAAPTPSLPAEMASPVPAEGGY